MILILMSSCNTTRYLEKDQSLLKKTKIIFKNEKIIKDKKSLESDLNSFIDQKPNEKLLFFIPKEWLFLANSKPEDDKWYNKGLRGLGDPPVIFSEEASKTIAGNMENYLKFKKGYYEAKVDFIVDEKRSVRGWTNSDGNDVWESNISEVTYIVSQGERFKVKSVSYESTDSKLLDFIKSIEQDAFVKKGDYIDFSQFELEKSRLTVELQNHGYANFANNYIEISGDSSRINKEVYIFFIQDAFAGYDPH